MPRPLSGCICFGTAVSSLLLLAGCGGPAQVDVSGKLASGGKPLTGGDIHVYFMRMLDGKDKFDPPVEAEVDKTTGAFKARIPAGKHRIAVVQYDADLKDKLEDRFGQGSSKIVMEINESKDLGSIDLSKDWR
jgi:hypothetical protein